MTFNNTQVTKSTGMSACHWYDHGKVKSSLYTKDATLAYPTGWKKSKGIQYGKYMSHADYQD